MINYYHEVMLELFKSRSKDKNQTLKKLQEEIQINQGRLKYAQQMRLDKEIDAKEYQEIKSRYEETISKLMRDIANISQVDADYQDYLDFGFHVLANLDKYYEQGDVLAKQQMIGLIYPEKLIFENNQCRTTKQREVIEYITRTVKGLEENKNGTDKNFSYQSPMVRAKGLEPPRLAAPDPKSGASANFATPALNKGRKNTNNL